MIRSLSKLVVRTADLMEAEGRMARVELLGLTKAILIYGVASVGVLVGALAVAAGAFLALREVVGTPIALMAMGAALLLLSFAACHVMRKREDRPTTTGEDLP